MLGFFIDGMEVDFAANSVVVQVKSDFVAGE